MNHGGPGIPPASPEFRHGIMHGRLFERPSERDPVRAGLISLGYHGYVKLIYPAPGWPGPEHDRVEANRDIRPGRSRVLKPPGIESSKANKIGLFYPALIDPVPDPGNPAKLIPVEKQPVDVLIRLQHNQILPFHAGRNESNFFYGVIEGVPDRLQPCIGIDKNIRIGRILAN